MADGHVNPEVFAGADADAARDDELPADIEIATSFSAERLKHLERPSSRSRTDPGELGEPRDEQVRENLPAPIEPGRVYERPAMRRVVGVRLRAEKARRNGG